MNSDSSPRKRRRYNNSLREEQAQQTRERILDGLTELLLAGRIDELSVPAIAEQTGVSTATIYRYFPNRDELFEALNEHYGRVLGRPRLPATVDDLTAGAPEMLRYYAANFEVMRLIGRVPSVLDVREHGRRGRDEVIAGAVAPLTDHLEPERARAIQGVFRALFGFDTYETLHDRFDVDTEGAIEAMGWVARALVDALQRERAGRGAGPQPPRPAPGGDAHEPPDH